MAEQEQGKSIGWVCTAAMIAVAAFGWGFAAADYFQSTPNLGGPAKADFFVNAFMQLPNFFAVVSRTFQRAIWIVILFSVLEVLVLVFALVAKKVDQQVYGPQSAKRKR
jgi:hypothetical protein